ncbi:hypothetical protein RUM44_005100 [Polyplax serrata]|uniref:Uncharacterized protein n=1 Tax=Polyplax serrata TaxID=468196 RepID=A0ABR1AFM3_POLSC
MYTPNSNLSIINSAKTESVEVLEEIKFDEIMLMADTKEDEREKSAKMLLSSPEGWQKKDVGRKVENI